MVLEVAIVYEYSRRRTQGIEFVEAYIRTREKKKMTAEKVLSRLRESIKAAKARRADSEHTQVHA